MKIQRDEDMERKLIDSLRGDFKEREGVHISELIWCFAPGALVSTTQGWKPIEEVKVGDWVLTHRNRFMPVTEVHQRHYEGKMLRVKVIGEPPFLCTPEHRILVRDRTKWGVWKKAEEIKVERSPRGGYYRRRNVAVIPTLRNPLERWGTPPFAKLRLGKDMAWLAGLFLAEGNCGGRKWGHNQVHLSLGKHENELEAKVAQVLRKLGKPFSVQDYDYATAKTITMSDKRDFFQQFYLRWPFRAENKYLPPWVYSLPDDEKKAIVEGYIEGDGYERNTSIDFHVTSPALADGFRLLLQSLGYRPSVYVTTSHSTKIGGRKLRLHRGFNLSIAGSDLVKWRGYGSGGSYTAKKLPRIYTEEEDYKGDVFNLSVALDESYTVNGVAVHNCLRKAWIRRKYNVPVPDNKVLKYARGRFLHKLFWVPGKEELFKRESIYGTPDGVEEIDGRLYPLEIKTTVWQVKNLEKQDFWLKQLASYCYLAETTVGFLGVFQIVGYGQDRDPKIHAWRVEFTKEELKEHWRELRSRRDLLVDCLERNVPPPKSTVRYDFECNDCECKELCKVLRDEEAK